MTPLPPLPSNLSTDNVEVGLSSVTSQIVPQFPVVPTLPNIPSVNGLTGQVQGLVSNTLSGPVLQLQQFSAAGAATLALIEAAIPEDKVTELIESYRLPGGTVDLDSVKVELNKINDNINKSYETVINGLQRPPVSVSGILAELIPEIPVPDIPSPAEIKQYINNLIDKRKQLEQQAIMKAQKIAAERELLPFTARSEENII